MDPTLILMAADLAVDLAGLAAAALTKHFAEVFAKRFVEAVIETAADHGRAALSSFGSDMLGTAMSLLTGKVTVPGANLEKAIEAALSGTMTELGVSIIPTKQVTVLLNLAAAAEGKGDMGEALAAWKALKTEGE